MADLNRYNSTCIGAGFQCPVFIRINAQSEMVIYADVCLWCYAFVAGMRVAVYNKLNYREYSADAIVMAG